MTGVEMEWMLKAVARGGGVGIVCGCMDDSGGML
jgi:hypothetical protein